LPNLYIEWSLGSGEAHRDKRNGKSTPDASGTRESASTSMDGDNELKTDN
jgi:hypothetical protein